VQVVVELPGLVADPQVVLVAGHQVLEDHEVGDEDLVHRPPGLEAVEVVLGRLALDVARLVGQERTGGMDPLAVRLEDLRHRVLGQPVDLEVRVQLAQLVGDGDVALRVAQPDGGGDEEGALPARPPSHPPLRRGCRRVDRVDEPLQQQVHLDRVACVGEVPGTFEAHEATVRAFGQLDRPRVGRDGVLVAGDHQNGAANAGAEAHERLADLLRRAEPHALGRVDQRLGRRLQPPADAVLDLLGGVRFVERL
jgi:hypothetical protein